MHTSCTHIGVRGVGQFVTSIASPQTRDTLGSTLSRFLKNRGFETFTYAGLRFPSRTFEQRPVISTYPREWVRKYEYECFESIDPTVAFATQSIKPVVWADILGRNDLSPSQREIFEEASGFNLRHGMTVPIHGQSGDFALLSIASDCDDREFWRRLTESMHDIHIVSLYYHEAVRENLTSPLQESTNIQLTNRERECLLWTARGKTSWEISEILGLSENTVNFYIKNAMKKFGVFNKSHAVVRAIMLYLIIP